MQALLGLGLQRPGELAGWAVRGDQHPLRWLDPFPSTSALCPETLRVWWWQVGRGGLLRGPTAVSEMSSVAVSPGAERGRGTRVQGSAGGGPLRFR